MHSCANNIMEVKFYSSFWCFQERESCFVDDDVYTSNGHKYNKIAKSWICNKPLFGSYKSREWSFNPLWPHNLSYPHPYSYNRLLNFTGYHSMFSYISWTHCGPTTKILLTIDHDPNIVYTKKFNEFEATF